MSTSFDIAGRNIVVAGLGATGLSVARWAHRRGARVRVVDTRDAPPQQATLARELPDVRVTTGELERETFAGADLVALSPGISRAAPGVSDAIASGVEVVGDVELFARSLPSTQRTLAITGSNGKTTTTALTGELVRAAGLDVRVAGNIGEPVLDAMREIECGARAPDVFVLELSSFQLESTSSLEPTSATVLNVSPNHLDRYADVAAYAQAKSRIFAGSGAQVLNRDDACTMAMRRPGRDVQTFGREAPRDASEWGIASDADGAMLARGERRIVPLAALALEGRHNAMNALAALALASSVVEIGADAIAALRAFRGLPHRMEALGDIAGVHYVNDSKATTVGATLAALEGIGRPAVLIAGGDGKNQDFAALRPAVERHCRAVVLLGRDAAKIEAALSGATPIERAGDLADAVERARAKARPGDVVLLSPACASLDMFRDYADRGERFRSLVAARARELAHA